MAGVHIMVKSIAFSSGKGGVGKTSIAVNCALALKMRGASVALLDADFGMANSHIMLDQKVTGSLLEVIEGSTNLDFIICETPHGIKLIPGGSGVIELLNLHNDKRWKIIKSIGELENKIDYLIVDTPAGGSDAAIDFATACDEICIVLVGEPTSFMDAYSFIKALHLERGYDYVSVLVNMASSEANAIQTFDNFAKTVAKFMPVEVKMIGWLPKSQILQKSILSRQPFILQEQHNGKTLLSNMRRVVEALSMPVPSKQSSIKFFNG